MRLIGKLPRVLIALFFTATAVSASYTCTNVTLLSGIAETDIFAVFNSSIVSFNETTQVPEYCDIEVKIGGRIIVWLKFPIESSWNGRYSQYGCGGGCGYNAFEDGTDADAPLKAGYAIATTDMGMFQKAIERRKLNVEG
jgi:hypothetical protein